jgi:hypothetical protein
MQMNWKTMSISFLVLIPPVTTSLAMGPETSSKTVVDVTCSADDGLSQRLRDSIENKFSSSPDFQINSGKTPPAMIVSIPTKVSWKNVKKRAKVIYAIDFKLPSGQQIGQSKGDCWDDNLAECASHIVSDARRVTGKIR